ncbi:MAG: extracellular solute-binding protein [Microbacteriaceae bacterium]|nr:extracellular solute-binding protein [Microbacteriaceae bacterium]
MKFPIRKLVATMSIAMLGLTACSGGEGNKAAEEPKSNEPVTLDFWHSSSGAAGDHLNKLIEEFNKSHEGKITIKGSYQGSYEDAISKFIASVQSGKLPALLQASDVQTTYLKDSGLIVPAGDLAKEDKGYSFDSLIPAVTNYYTIENKVYSMPAMISLPTLYVNEEMLQKAGVSADSLKTTEGLLAGVKKIKEATGKAGITFHQNGWFMEQFAASLGVHWCTPENGVKGKPGDAFNLEDSKIKGFWGNIGKLYASGAVANPGKDGSVAAGAFTSGEAAILLNSSGVMGNIFKANPSFKWTTIPLPRDNAQSGSVPGGNSIWAVKEGHSKAEQKAAWEFMKFIGSEKSQKSIFTASGYLPTVKSAASSLTDIKPQQASMLKQLESNPVNTITAGCHTGALNDARKSYGAAISELSNGVSVDDAFKKAKAGTETAINDYKKRSGKKN